jgi:hypothetical protein
MKRGRRVIAATIGGLVFGTCALLAGFHLPAGAQTTMPQLHTAAARPFQSDAFDTPAASARMTPVQVTNVLSKAVDLRGHQVSIQYTGWTAPGLFRRVTQNSTSGQGPETSGRLNGTPYGHLNVWKVTVDLTTTDPGGAGACPAGSTADTCPGMRVFHHMVYLIDDKSGQILMASPN